MCSTLRTCNYVMGRKMNRKKIFGIVSALLILLGVCGCGKQAENTSADSPESVSDEYVYVAEYLPLGAEGNAVSNVIFGDKQNILYLESDDETVHLCSMNLDTFEAEEIPVALEENMYMTALSSDAEGNLLIGAVRYADDAEDWIPERVIIKKVTADGGDILSFDADSVLGQTDYFYISNLLTDNSGNFYIGTGEDIFVLNAEGIVICKISPGYYISNLFTMKDGRVVAAYYGERGWELKEVNPEEKALKALSSPIQFDYGVYQGGKDTDLLYTQETVLYSCNLADAVPEAILKWTDYDINSYNLTAFAVLEDGRIAALTNDFTGAGDLELALLTKKNKAEVPEKKILTYGAQYVSYFAERDIIAFNRQSKEYRIEVKEYGDAGMNIADKAAIFAAEIADGQAPDMIDMRYCPMSLDSLIAAGVVEDLNPYLDADEIINRDDYVETVLEAYERDGKLYAIMPYYGIKVIMGKKSDLGERKAWNIDDVIALADSKGREVDIIPGSTKNSVLEFLCMMNQGLFVDEENGKCSFAGDDFKKILEFSNRFPENTDYVPGDFIMEEIREGQILLYSNMITSVQEYQMYEFLFGEPVTFIGYPVFEGSGLTLTSNGTTVAMSAGSENKEGVWEFIRFNLTKERQENADSPNGGFPALKTALQKQLEESMEADYYTAPDGTKKEQSKGSWSMMDFTVDVYAAAKEQTDRIEEMINSAQSDVRIEQGIFDIISEEAYGYFSGQKSAEDVAAVVENRVQLYLNETR